MNDVRRLHTVTQQAQRQASAYPLRHGFNLASSGFRVIFNSTSRKSLQLNRGLTIQEAVCGRVVTM